MPISCRLLSLIFFLFTTVCFADELHYSIVINAGSTASRVHLFAYDIENNQLPKITSVFWEETPSSLSSFANNPQEAGSSLKVLLDDVTQKLQQLQIDPSTVNLQLLGTGGMRLLSDDIQQQIYAHVTAYVQQNYDYPITTMQTISGKMEGIYDWLDVNYLSNRFQDQQTTLGAIDLGGASTQIAYETNDFSASNDELDINIAGRNYHLFSKSFLGLGIFQALNAMNHLPMASSCYPTHYVYAIIHGDFNSVSCHQAFATVINDNNVTQQLVPYLNDLNFVAFSAAYDIYQFFGVSTSPNEAAINKSINTLCTQSWEQLQEENPNIPNNYLAVVCASGIYISELFYQTYKLSSTQLTVTDTINSESVDWSLGALLYRLLYDNT